MKRELNEKASFVIAAGCSDEEIATLKAAFEILFHKPCYDLLTMISKHPEHIRKWIDLDSNLPRSLDLTDEVKPADCDLIRQMLQGYKCAVDFPVISYYWFVMHTYPEAKVVIALPDTTSWSQYLRKIRAFQLQLADSRPGLGIPLAHNSNDLGDFLDRVCSRLIGSANNLDNDQLLSDGLARWIQDGRDRIPADNLLVYNTDDEWDTLCEFLGMEVPNTPFPDVKNQDRLSECFRILHNISQDNISNNCDEETVHNPSCNNKNGNNDKNEKEGLTNNSEVVVDFENNSTNTKDKNNITNTNDSDMNNVNNTDIDVTKRSDENNTTYTTNNNNNNNNNNKNSNSPGKQNSWGLICTAVMLVAVGTVLVFVYKRKSRPAL